MKKSKVFEETYDKYMSQISAIDLISRAERLGAEPAGDALIIPYYKKPFRISIEGVFDEIGKRANFAISVVLFQYVFSCPVEIPLAGDWVSYREFKDAGPLAGYFTSNTNKIIETTFAGNPEAIRYACKRLERTSCLIMTHPGIFRWNSICCPEYRSVFDLTIKKMNSRLSAPSCSGNPPNPISIWKVWP